MQMILVPRLLAAATANNPKLEAVCVDETWCPPTVENSAPFSLFYQVSFRFVSFRFVLFRLSRVYLANDIACWL
jgi:hypothetical protein